MSKEWNEYELLFIKYTQQSHTDVELVIREQNTRKIYTKKMIFHIRERWIFTIRHTKRFKFWAKCDLLCSGWSARRRTKKRAKYKIKKAEKDQRSGADDSRHSRRMYRAHKIMLMDMVKQKGEGKKKLQIGKNEAAHRWNFFTNKNDLTRNIVCRSSSPALSLRWDHQFRMGM